MDEMKMLLSKMNESYHQMSFKQFKDYRERKNKKIENKHITSVIPKVKKMSKKNIREKYRKIYSY